MSRPKWVRLAVWFVAGLLSLCLLLSLASYLANRAIPGGSASVGTLSSPEKARLAEALQVRSTFGEAVWPGFGQADIPVLEYNEAYAFLTGYVDPPTGWEKVPGPGLRGQAWQAVAGDAFRGQVYYRQPVEDAAGQIGSFTVRIGERWTASMVTKEWGSIEMVSQVRDVLPPVAKDVVPYRLLLPQVLDSDQYIFKLVHESFHAFQGRQATDRLMQAELAARQYEGSYPWDDQAQRDGWLREFQALKAGLQAQDAAQRSAAVRQFLQERQERRSLPGFSAEWAPYEMQREWLEGVALYVEYFTWQNVVQAPGYQPQAELKSDSDFHGYSAFQSKMDAAIASPRLLATQRDTRFYSAGMMQAFLLDDLMPGWKSGIFNEGVYLEDLLRQAVGE